MAHPTETTHENQRYFRRYSTAVSSDMFLAASPATPVTDRPTGGRSNRTASLGARDVINDNH